MRGKKINCQLLKKIKFKIYTLKSCIYCDLSKDILIKKNIKFEEITLDDNLILFEQLIKKTGSKTVPQIFIDQKFIGGYLDLKKFLNEKKI